MKTDNRSIDYVLTMNNTSFFIPPFQRAYAWGRTEIDRYFSDIKRIINSEIDTNQHDKLEHFFGTLVIKEEKDGFASKSIIVDGQQRLTTTLLLLIALRDLEEDKTNQDIITQNYLTNNSSTYQDKIKLKQVTKDWEAYRALVVKKEPVNGVISRAYSRFKELIEIFKKSNSAIELKHFITAIQRMNVALIFLDERSFKGEDPQIIFETLNSLGKPLSLSDLIRNYVLLKMDSKRQSDIYEKTWHPQIEALLQDETSKFFRDYLQLKTHKSVKAISDNNTKEIYQQFTEFVEENFNSHNEFIEDIVRYAKWYKWIVTDINTDSISKNGKNTVILELLRNIFHDIKTEAFKPFVLGLLESHQTNVCSEMSDDLLISILLTIRTYLIRRRILGLTQGENKDIATMCKNIGDLRTQKVTMIELLSTSFYKMRFPNDDEISNYLLNCNFYVDIRKYAKFVLGKIEEHNAKVSIDFRDPKITIEHIMPQTLSDSWKKDLGVNFEEIHKKYLHNIGNLILTEFNSEIGNKPFVDKKIKLTSSSLYYRMNIIGCNIWNELSIQKHNKEMIEYFLQTFPLPNEYKNSSNWNTTVHEETDFSPLDKDAGDLAEGNKPSEIIIYDKVFPISTWQEVFINFLSYIKKDNLSNYEYVFDNQNELFGRIDVIVTERRLISIINDNPDMIKRYKTFEGKIYDMTAHSNDQNQYIHINISASVCVNRIKYIMDKLNMEDSSVRIILK